MLCTFALGFLCLGGNAYYEGAVADDTAYGGGDTLNEVIGSIAEISNGVTDGVVSTMPFIYSMT